VKIGAGKASITAARRALQSAAETRDFAKAAADLMGEAVNKWIYEQTASQYARRRKSVMLSC